MKKIFKDIIPNFVISTGRTGTKFLTLFLNEHFKQIDARHEPGPSIIKLRYKFGTGKISLKKAIDQFYKLKFDLYSNISSPIYIELNPYLSYLIPVIKKVFSDYKIIHIVRDGRDFLRSAMSRGIFNTILDKTSLPILPFLRFIDDHLFKFKRLRLKRYFREIWRIRANDFKNDIFSHGWSQMTQFEKLAWNWNKQNQVISENIKDDKNAISIKFEDIFQKKEEYEGLHKLIGFLNLNENWNLFDIDLDNIFSKRIHASKHYVFPHWKDWNKDMMKNFYNIAGKMMRYYGYSP